MANGHTNLFSWGGHLLVISPCSSYVAAPCISFSLLMLYILISLLCMICFVDVFECGISWPSNNLLYQPCSIRPFNIFLGKLWFINLNCLHHYVVINFVLIFIGIIWSNFMIIDTTTTIFKLNDFSPWSTIIARSLDDSIVIWTPGMDFTYFNDRMFTMKSSLYVYQHGEASKEKYWWSFSIYH